MITNSELMQSSMALVNHTNIEKYKNQNVVIHGKVQSVKNNTLNLLIDPKGNHDLLVNGFNKDVPTGEFLAVIGKVASDNSLDYIDMIQLDKDFDLEFVNEIIPLSMHPNAKCFFERN